MTAKRWFDSECRHCGGRFLEAAKLLFHRCPAETDACRGRRNADRRPAKGKVATTNQRFSPASPAGRPPGAVA